MSNILNKAIFMIAIIVCMATGLQAQNIDKLPAVPLEKVVTVQLKPVSNENRIPAITWGGDVATKYAEMEKIFEQNKFGTPDFFCENDFAKQVQGCLNGETPYLRGTLGMLDTAAPVFEKAGTGLVWIGQLTWSTGGDAIVARAHIKTIADLKGKKIVCQRYGPHADYLVTLLANAGLKPSDVEIIWVRELTIPEGDTGGKIVDPVSAFRADSSIAAVMCIIPDALSLTGNEGGVEGAWRLSTTKTNDRVIADGYAVRLDYFQKNRGKVEAFVKSMLKGQEALKDLLSKKDSQQAKYRQVLADSSKLIWGMAEAAGETEALLGDCTFVYLSGNVEFSTGKGTTRNLENMTRQIQGSFLEMGLISSRAPLGSAGWDWDALGRTLGSSTVADSSPRFDAGKAQRAVEGMIDSELGSWEQAATLFVREVYFPPKSSDFDASGYAMMYSEVAELAQTSSGAIVVIEGHADPLGILKAQQEGKSQTELNMIRQRVKNLSLERAEAVKAAFLEYCKGKGLKVDASQFVAVGLGVDSPKHFPVKTEQQWNENRRVAFRVKNVEAELEKFEVVGGQGK